MGQETLNNSTPQNDNAVFANTNTNVKIANILRAFALHQKLFFTHTSATARESRTSQFNTHPITEYRYITELYTYFIKESVNLVV